MSAPPSVRGSQALRGSTQADETGENVRAMGSDRRERRGDRGRGHRAVMPALSCRIALTVLPLLVGWSVSPGCERRHVCGPAQPHDAGLPHRFRLPTGRVQRPRGIRARAGPDSVRLAVPAVRVRRSRMQRADHGRRALLGLHDGVRSARLRVRPGPVRGGPTSRRRRGAVRGHAAVVSRARPRGYRGLQGVRRVGARGAGHGGSRRDGAATR